MWDNIERKKILRDIKKSKDLYKFLELTSIVHESIADDFKKQKTLSLKEDLEFLENVLDLLKPRITAKSKGKEEPKDAGPEQTGQLKFDTNIYYTLEGLVLGLKEYLEKKPKEEIVGKTNEEDIKQLLNEAYRTLLKAKKGEDMESCKGSFSRAAALVLSGVPMNEYFASSVPYKDNNRVMLWTECIMQVIEHSKDYPITAPSDFQNTIDAIWRNLKKYEIDKSLLEPESVKENYKKINILVKNFIKEFLNNKTEIEKAINILMPMYIEYVDRLANPKVKGRTAASAAKKIAGKSEVVDCKILNIDSSVINKMIADYNEKYSKSVVLVEDDYLTVWKILLKKRKLLSKKPAVVFVDAFSGEVVGSYL